MQNKDYYLLLYSITQYKDFYEEFFPDGFFVRSSNPFEEIKPKHGMFFCLDIVHCMNINKDLYKGRKWVSRKRLKVDGIEKVMCSYLRAETDDNENPVYQFQRR